MSSLSTGCTKYGPPRDTNGHPEIWGSIGAILVLARRHDGRAGQQFHRCRIVVSQPRSKKQLTGASTAGRVWWVDGEGWLLLLPRSNGRRGPKWWCHYSRLSLLSDAAYTNSDSCPVHCALCTDTVHQTPESPPTLISVVGR